jgi:hypothetical protein
VSELKETRIGVWGFGYTQPFSVGDIEKAINASEEIKRRIAQDNTTLTSIQEMVSRRYDSYALKHIFENQIGYTSNGVFIIAMMLAGFPLRSISGHNCRFGPMEDSEASK